MPHYLKMLVLSKILKHVSTAFLCFQTFFFYYLHGFISIKEIKEVNCIFITGIRKLGKKYSTIMTDENVQREEIKCDNSKPMKERILRVHYFPSSSFLF